MAEKLSKRRRANEALKVEDALQPHDACATLKKFKAPKFDQTVNIVMVLGIDPKQADQAIRGSVSLPKGIGVKKKVVAFCREDVAKLAKEDLVQKIEGGFMDFDVAVATPDMMRIVSRLGKVLGPKGLMPSPKAGTVTPDVPTAVKEYSAGKVEYRNDAGGNVHAVLGKMSFSADDLAANLSHFVHHIEKSRPQTAKGHFIKKIVVSGSMTPGVQVKYEQKLEE
jgi:large subunit ribosomal protein L1